MMIRPGDGLFCFMNQVYCISTTCALWRLNRWKGVKPLELVPVQSQFLACNWKKKESYLHSRRISRVKFPHALLNVSLIRIRGPSVRILHSFPYLRFGYRWRWFSLTLARNLFSCLDNNQAKNLIFAEKNKAAIGKKAKVGKKPGWSRTKKSIIT